MGFETVRMAKAVLERELRNEKSAFWDFKMRKCSHPEARFKNHISVDDIQWLLKGAWRGS